MSYTQQDYETLLRGQQDQNRKAAGRAANDAGNGFQAALDEYNAILVNQGRVARVFRQFPPMRSIVLNRQRVFQAIGDGPCDYGFVLPSGRFGIFDAKASGSAKVFTWSSDQVHQIEELSTVHNATKGVSPAFALVNWYKVGECRLHPVWTFDQRTIRREVGTLVIDYDWPAVVRALWGA